MGRTANAAAGRVSERVRLILYEDDFQMFEQMAANLGLTWQRMVSRVVADAVRHEREQRDLLRQRRAIEAAVRAGIEASK